MTINIFQQKQAKGKEATWFRGSLCLTTIPT